MQPSIRLIERIILGLTFIVSLLLILASIVTHFAMGAQWGWSGVVLELEELGVVNVRVVEV